MIVVGDEMQLPPSQFFASSNGDEENGGGQELFVYDLNADSFLNRAAAALPHVLLAWHYRSQHEALIQFCNKAFYKGELQTIPSVAELPKREPILVARRTMRNVCQPGAAAAAVVSPDGELALRQPAQSGRGGLYRRNSSATS